MGRAVCNFCSFLLAVRSTVFRELLRIDRCARPGLTVSVRSGGKPRRIGRFAIRLLLHQGSRPRGCRPLSERPRVRAPPIRLISISPDARWNHQRHRGPPRAFQRFHANLPVTTAPSFRRKPPEHPHRNHPPVNAVPAIITRVYRPAPVGALILSPDIGPRRGKRGSRPLEQRGWRRRPNLPVGPAEPAGHHSPIRSHRSSPAHFPG